MIKLSRQIFGGLLRSVKVKNVPFYNQMENQLKQQYLTCKCASWYSQFQQKRQEGVEKIENTENIIVSKKEDVKLQDSQEEFIKKQIAQKEAFDELFNIFVEKKKDQMRIVRLYHFYKRRYKKQRMNFKTFLLLNVVVLLGILMVPSKELTIQKNIQMAFVIGITDVMERLQRNVREGGYEFVSGKRYIEFTFIALKYLARNDIFDLDYLVRIIHEITLIIYTQRKQEDNIANNMKNHQEQSRVSQQNVGHKSTHSSANQMILGSMSNIAQVLEEIVQIRPKVFLERDFQQALADYFEIISLGASELASTRKNFMENKANLLNSETYSYFIQNQLNFNKVAAILLAYSPKDKCLVYDSIYRLITHNIDWDQYLLDFLLQCRQQLYSDIAGKNQKQNTEEKQVYEDISYKSLRVVSLLYHNLVCQKKLTQDKLLSNLIKHFIIKQNNKFEKEIRIIVSILQQNKEILTLKDSSQFRDEFIELQKLRLNPNNKLKEIIDPLFK